MPNTRFGSSHLVLKGESMILWTYADTMADMMQDLQRIVTFGVAPLGFAGYPTMQSTGVWAAESHPWCRGLNPDSN